MSSDDDAPGRGTNTLLQLYVQSLDARIQFVESAAAGMTAAEREAHHANLHSSILAWWEALWPYLEERDDMERWREEVRLWPKGPVIIRVLHCQQCEQFYEWRSDGNLFPGADCPICGPGFVRPTEVYDRTEEGKINYEWARGLDTLDGWQNRTTTVTKEKGTFRKKTVVEEKPVRLPPEVLFRVGRHLDKAAERLDLLADVETEVPKTELDMETIENFQATVQEIVQEAADEGEVSA